MEQDVLNICCYNKVNYLKLNYVACTYLWDYFDNEKEKSKDRVYAYEEIKDAMENPIQLLHQQKQDYQASSGSQDIRLW